MHPQPSDAVLSDLYSSNYFIGSESESAFQRVAELKRATAEIYVAAIHPFVRATQPRLLELGCGSGDFLLAAQQRGFVVEGLEYSAHAAQVANQRLGLSAVNVGSLDTTALADNRYHLIAGFDVIEHVRHPAVVLEQLSRAIRPGGLIVLVTPSLDSWSRRLLGKFWMEYKTEHLTYFGEQSLRFALQQVGLSEITFLSNKKCLSVDYIAEHFMRYRVPVLSSLVKMFRSLLPDSLAHAQFQVVASGTMVLARKTEPRA